MLIEPQMSAKHGVEKLFKNFIEGKVLTLRDNELFSLDAAGKLHPLLSAPPVEIVASIGKEGAREGANISRYSYRLSCEPEPFWISLFTFFQNSGFSVFITDDNTLQVTTFEGLHQNAMSIAKNCISLSNSTYKHFYNRAKALARSEEQARSESDEDIAI